MQRIALIGTGFARIRNGPPFHGARDPPVTVWNGRKARRARSRRIARPSSRHRRTPWPARTASTSCCQTTRSWTASRSNRPRTPRGHTSSTIRRRCRKRTTTAGRADDRAADTFFCTRPCSCSPQMAADGVGLYRVGPDAEFSAVRDALGGMTGDVWYLGERTDLAAAYKLFGNCMLFAISGGLADASRWPRAPTRSTRSMRSACSRISGGQHHLNRGPRMARGEFTPPSSRSRWRQGRA